MKEEFFLRINVKVRKRRREGERENGCFNILYGVRMKIRVVRGEGMLRLI